jgi:hypothetical protein
MKMRRFGTPLVGVALVCAACGNQGSAVTARVDPLDPAAVDDHLVVVDRGRSEALLLDVSGPGNATPTAVPVIGSPTVVQPRNAHSNELLVLSSGHPDDGKAPFERPGLVVIGADGKTREYRYDNAFDTLTQSDDGKFAFLSASGATTDALLSDSNEVAIVDLSKTGAPDVRSLRSFGGTPTKVVFSPEMDLVGEKRRLAVVLFDSDLAIIDLNHLDRSEYTVGLSRPGASPLGLSQVLFSSIEHKIYLRAENSNDIYVISLADRAGSGASLGAGDGGTAAGENDFTPSVNQLGAGVDPSDMVLYTETDAATNTNVVRLLVASPGSAQAVVIEPDSSNVTQVPLPGPGRNILLFQQPKPSDPKVSPRALFYTPGASAVAFVDLVDVQTRGARNVELLTIPQVYGSVLSLDTNTVMMLHQATGLSLLNLSDRTVTRIQGPNLLGAVSDPSNEKLWLASGDRVGFLDLAKGVHPSEVRLDTAIATDPAGRAKLVTVPSKTHPRLAVSHASSTGWVTVLDAKTPTDLSQAFSLRGFLLTDAISGGAQ